MENKITHEFIEKVRQAKNAEEFIAIVKENGIEIPEDKVKALFEKLKSVLSDEELGGVSGGVPSDICADIIGDDLDLDFDFEAVRAAIKANITPTHNVTINSGRVGLDCSEKNKKEIIK